MSQATGPLRCLTGPNSSSSSSSSSQPSLPTTPETDFSFSSTHLLPKFLQDVPPLVSHGPRSSVSRRPDMAQSFALQSELHPLHSYVERWQALKQYSDSKDELIQQLLLGWNQAATELTEINEHLKKQLQDSQLDLENATKARRDLQMQVAAKDRQMERFAHDVDGLKNRNPYVMVLIDGDGLLFQEQLIGQGIEGGKQAGYALRSAIAEYCNDYAGDLEVVAKAAANMNGLSRAMQRDGAIQDTEMKDFALGFTQARSSFDFVDVGYGKERADSKIKELTRWHLRNHNCKQVFLGVSHDSGYAPFLDEILQDDSTRKRVTVLEGVPTVRELRATGVKIYSSLSETLFRKDKLNSFIPNGYTNGRSRQEESTTSGSTTMSQRSNSPPAPPVLSTASSWAVVTRSASPPPKITTPLAHRLTTPAVKLKEQSPQTQKWSPGPRGMDPPVSATGDAMESIKNREKNNKYCNNFYLRGSCVRKNLGCPFNHESKPSPEELAAIKLLTRMNPCASGQDCYIEDCIYGHHCPSVRDGICGHPYCKFSKDLHPPNTRFANKNIKDNV